MNEFLKGEGHSKVEKELLTRVGKIGEEIGLEWGGAWRNFVDTPHFQYTGGLTIEDLKKGMRLVEDNRYSIQRIPMWVEEKCKEVEAIHMNGYYFVRLQDLRSQRIIIDYDAVKKCPSLKIV